jgi:hypothetical protein
MNQFPLPSPNSRIGYHYYPDTSHFRKSDIKNWLSILNKLGASWLVLKAPSGRVIPEHFINGLLNDNIFPILQFQQPLDQVGSTHDIQLLLNIYARWGIKYIIAFDQPNNQKFWKPSDWVQDSLVDRFLDRYITIAQLMVDEGLIPVFPPLHPGGDYWDLVFLQLALRGLVRRNLIDLVDQLVFSAIASTNGRSLVWGCGGSSRWPGARPYYTPPGCQDHRGVNIAEWYSEIIREETGKIRPILMLKLGDPIHPLLTDNQDDAKMQTHITNTLELIKALYPGEEPQLGTTYQPEVICGCFNFLDSCLGNFQTENVLPSINAFEKFAINRIINWMEDHLTKPQIKGKEEQSQNLRITLPDKKMINHYLLLPLYVFGVADWDLDAVRPFIIKNHPTIGFSIDEATCARHVTVLETSSKNMDLIINKLVSAGCIVDTLKFNGMNIAP